MPGTITQLQNEPVKSELIPAGRENDYREVSAPAVSFLDMVIDESTMYVSPLPITNGSEDRDGEVTNPDGMIDVAYKANPIVFLQHSHRISPMVPPVGNAETADRIYDVSRVGDTWFSGCRFTQTTKFATQVFAMVADGLIRGRSIGALNHSMSPYRPKHPGVAFHQNQIIPVRTKSVSHDQYELVEWSWVYIPSNRDMVTPMKSIMSKGWFDGRPLDDSLKMIMKSFDLAEPASNAKHMSRKPRFNWPKLTGDTTVKSPAMILFNAKNFSMTDVRSFMGKNADLGIVPTEIESVKIGRETFLKSTQFKHAGEFHTCEDPKVPGLKVMFAKAFGDEDKPVVEPAKPSEQVDQLISEPAAGRLVATEKPPAPAQAPVPTEKAVAAPEAPAEQEAEQVENPDAEAIEEAAGPGGMKYLKALIKNASQLADMAEAASADQEPEMMEKCGEFTSTLRAFIGKVSEFHDERYGKKKPEGDEAATEEPSATLTKATKSGLFYGTKVSLPGQFVRGLRGLHDEVKDDQHKTLIGMILKGVAIPEPTPDPEQMLRDKVREILLRTRVQEGVSQLV